MSQKSFSVLEHRLTIRVFTECNFDDVCRNAVLKRIRVDYGAFDYRRIAVLIFKILLWCHIVDTLVTHDFKRFWVAEKIWEYLTSENV